MFYNLACYYSKIHKTTRVFEKLFKKKPKLSDCTTMSAKTTLPFTAIWQTFKMLRLTVIEFPIIEKFPTHLARRCQLALTFCHSHLGLSGNPCSCQWA